MLHMVSRFVESDRVADPEGDARRLRIKANDLFDELITEFRRAVDQKRVPAPRELHEQLNLSLSLLEQAQSMAAGEPVNSNG